MRDVSFPPSPGKPSVTDSLFSGVERLIALHAVPTQPAHRFPDHVVEHARQELLAKVNGNPGGLTNKEREALQLFLLSPEGEEFVYRYLDLVLELRANPSGTQPESDDPSPRALRLLLMVLSNGVVDKKINMAVEVLLDNGLSANEKLMQIHALIPIPPTASANDLASMLGGISKTAVIKTPWWTQNRRGIKAGKSEARRRRLIDCSKLNEISHAFDDAE